MSKPFCSTGEPWGVECTTDNPEEVWKLFRDTTNDDLIMFVNGGDDGFLELRLNKKAAWQMALTLAKAAINDDSLYNRFEELYLEF